MRAYQNELPGIGCRVPSKLFRVTAVANRRVLVEQVLDTGLE